MNLAVPLRSAIIADTAITDNLSAYNGSFPVFTRRPVPADTPFPFIAISPDIASNDTLAQLNSETLEIIRDIGVYGQQEDAATYRTVETIAYAVRDLFNRHRRAFTVSGYSVQQVLASGPIIGPGDDFAKVARIVTLTVTLVRQ